MAGKVTLQIIDGPIQGQRFEFDEHDMFLFGRSRRDCHAALPDDMLISRHQFMLEINPPDVRIRDLGSRNGTYVNGTRYGGRAIDETPKQGARHQYPDVDLTSGDLITVGKTSICVSIELPVYCAACGAEIPDRVDQGLGSKQQSWCDACNKQEHTLPHAPLPHAPGNRCSQCGKDVSEEIGTGRRGEYVCQACRGGLQSDPLGLLRRLMEEAANNAAQESIPVVTGYEVADKVGQGGMGAVYRGRRKSDGETVAIKVMLSKVAVEPRSRDLFLREVEITKQLVHPNIVRFLDTGASGGAFYLAMQFCNGGSVLDVIERKGRTLDLRTTAPLMLQALAGLDYAHQRDFVHRDLKPHNILLHEEHGQWTAKISDFGLAKNFQKAGFSGMTATGHISGTLKYMPREQLTNFKYVQPVSDIWSLGATFYTMLTGRTPRDFPKDRKNAEVILEGKIVPIRRRKPKIPPAVAEVIDRSVADEPSERYQTAGEMRRALAEALGGFED